MFNIFLSTSFCFIIHKLAKYMPINNNNNFYQNIITCIIFQLLFIYNSAKLTYQGLLNNDNSQSIILKNDTFQNLDFLTGYFVYDILYLLKTNYFSPFLIHHFISILILHFIKSFSISTNLIWLYNALCFIGESTNPIINMRYLTKNTNYYNFNIKLIYYTYLVIRIILFPSFSYLFFVSIHNNINKFTYNSLKIMFCMIYFMSCYWLKKYIL